MWADDPVSEALGWSKLVERYVKVGDETKSEKVNE